jgi:hypothetical protein
MEVLKKLIIFSLFLVGFSIFAQNGLRGTGFGTFDWTTTDHFVASAGSSYILTTVANSTGDRYFRTVIDWGTVSNDEFTITDGVDVSVLAETILYPSAGPTTNGAMYFHVSNTAYNYIFKTRDAGEIPSHNLLLFEVQGDIRTITNVTNPANVDNNVDETITVTLSGALASGQGVYLRYTNDAFTTSTVVEMTGSGTTYTADISSTVNLSGKKVEYYAFTSGDGIAISHSNADFYTINLENNGGNNYNYTVSADDCSQLFISEYAHNNSGGNYIEIYNPSDITIDLTNYRIWRGYEGGAWPGTVVEFAGVNPQIGAHGVYIIRDDTGIVAGSYQEEASFNYSGDDNIGLAWNGGSGSIFTLIDSIGDDQGDPGDAWEVDGVVDGTYHHTLYRKKTIKKPNANWSVSSANEWVVGSYTQANLNFHHSTCIYYPCTTASHQVLLLDFESGQGVGYTTNPVEFCADYKYFTYTDGTNLGADVNFSGTQGNFFAVQDTNETADPVTLTINDIDISGYENLSFSILIAEDDSPFEGWDTNTSMHITYDIDNSGTFNNLLWVESTHSTETDHPPAIDVNFDGLGNYHYTITDTFELFTKEIAEVGSEIDLKIVFSNLNQGTEDIAIDNIKITADKVALSTYSSGSWDIAPTIEHKIVIDDNLTTSTTSVEACDCKVNTGKTLSISENDYLLVEGKIDNNGIIIVENKASLVQNNDTAVNSGSGIYQIHKTTPTYIEYDYTYWASPIENAQIATVFAANEPSKIYDFTTANFADLYDGSYPQTTGSADTFDDNADDWNVATGAMTVAKGYIAMGSGADLPYDGSNIATNLTQSVVFEGTINNGEKTIEVFEDANQTDAFDNQNLIGNPYPSAIDIKKLYSENQALFGLNSPLEGTFYFWTHGTQIGTQTGNPGPDAYNFTNDDYAVATTNGSNFNSTSSTGTVGKAAPEFIASGQGFFADTKDDGDGTASESLGNVVFKNSMRVTGSNNQFLRINTPTYDRIWLNMTKDDIGLFRQILVGFFDNATEDHDRGIDGKRLENGDNCDFYSILNTKRYAIQGLPTFNDTKTINLGIEIVESGTYEINIDHMEGLFTDGQVVYLEDTYEEIIHNFANGAYSFTTEVGDAIEDRFVLRFTNEALAIDDDILSTIVIYPNPSADIFTISVSSNDELSIEVYDITGKLAVKQHTGQQINLTGFTKGVYFVKLCIGGEQTIKKLVLK